MKTYNLLENSEFAKRVGESSRLMGIDPGKRNVGISVCDPAHLVATPYETIHIEKLNDLINGLNKIILENNIKGIVVGHPINMDGSEGPRSQSTKDFVKNILKYINLPITLWDERLSTEGAFRGMEALNSNSSSKKEKLDENSAAFILQGFIDFMRKK
jgi:putative Holliday junction resolvase